MSDQPQSERSLFLEVIERYPEERAAFLDAHCGENQQLRAEVEALLRAHDQAGDLLDAPDATSPDIDRPITETPGTQIGPYRLLERIGEGGMGVVYLAQQTEPVRRRVALKIIKPGMDTQQVIKRFEAERQALALMDHSNIAKVFDAGATETGRPYFVMEWVKGVPITQYCDEHQLNPRERLEIFDAVCQAVQHSHQKGIIHRDIKPSNVLVTRSDSRPVAKVIDFGLAKAMGSELVEKTVFTQQGQIVGTVEYMSPEQADLNPVDVDTRTDIYSLGVLLYELLTGETPFDLKRLRLAAFNEILRIIREEEPPRPSTKLSSSEALPSIAVNRHCDPKKLSTLVRGELDWIVMKALEKDRARRYATARDFAADVQHYLNDEAVAACPPSAGYRFRKFARRNKTLMATAALVATAIFAGIFGTSWQAIRAMRAEQFAKQRLAAEQLAHEEADQARRSESEQRSVAELERDRAEGNLDLALDALDAFYLEAIGEEKLLGGLHWSTPAASDEAPFYPPSLTETEKDLLRRGLSFYERFARKNAGSARAESQTAHAYYRVALLQDALGEDSDAAENYREAIARLEPLAKREPGNTWNAVALAKSYQGLAYSHGDWDRAKPLFEQSVAVLTTAITRNPEESQLYVNRAWSYDKLRQLDRKLEDFRMAAELRPDDAVLRADVAPRLPFNRQTKGAELSVRLMEEALQIDPDDPRVQIAAGLVCERVLRDRKRALEHMDRALTLETNDPNVLDRRAGLSEELGNYDQMLVDAEHAARLAPHNARYRIRVAEACANQGDYERALRELEKAEAVAPNEQSIYSLRGDIYSWRGDYEPALVAFNRAIEIIPAAWILKRRAAAHFYLGYYQEALADLRASIEKSPIDPSTLFRIPLRYVAACPDEDFRQGYLALADRLVELNRQRWTLNTKGTLYDAMGKHFVAVECFSSSIELDPDLPKTWLKRGRAYAALGDEEMAGRDFDKYIEFYLDEVEQNPENPKTWARRAHAHRRLGQWQRAIEDFTAAINRVPDRPVHYKNRAETYCLLERWGEAAEDFAKLINLGDKSIVTAYWHTLARLGAGEIDAYRQACNLLVKQHGESTNSDTLHWVAWSCSLTEGAVEDPARVVTVAQRALTAQPTNEFYRITLGTALYRADQFRQAADTLSPVADSWQPAPVKPTQSSPAYVWYFLAMAHHQMGHREEADHWLEKANQRADEVLAIDPTEEDSPRWNRRLTLQLLRGETETLLGRSEDKAEPAEETEDMKP